MIQPENMMNRIPSWFLSEKIWHLIQMWTVV